MFGKRQNKPEQNEQSGKFISEVDNEKKSKTHIDAFDIMKAAIALIACAAIVFALNFANNIIPANKTGPDYKSGIAESYDDIYSAIKSFNSVRLYSKGNLEAAAIDDDVLNDTAPPSSEQSKTSSADYSDTNLQVAGVQEADIIKTDGKYIYAVSSEYIYIVSALDGKLDIVSKLNRQKQDENKTSVASEIYITENRLIVIKNSYTKSNDAVKKGSAEIAPDIAIAPDMGYYGYYTNQTDVEAEIYDISDKANPKSLNNLGQNGYYSSSRMVGDVLYLISNYYVYNPDKKNPETFVPAVYENNNKSLVNANDIFIYDNIQSLGYTVISGIDTSGSGKIISTKSLLGCGNNIYANSKNLYVASYGSVTENDIQYNVTNLIRLSLDKGKIEIAATGSVPGGILNQFSMDEHEGIFRIVTTVYKYKIFYGSNNADDSSTVMIDGNTVSAALENNNTNALYTLDHNLNIIGKIEDLAPGERVYSVRFMGKTGYFVTFRQVDPLFAVDLSDPAEPKILSQLKIPGFSQYLHPYDAGLLFGLGKDADENTGRAGFIKLSMFDISDPANVTEKFKLIVDNTYNTNAAYNHKAILIDTTKKIIAFQADDRYLVYTYSDDSGFKLLSEIKLYSEFNGYYYGYYYDARGLYIGDWLYVFAGNVLSSYSMADFKYCDSKVFESSIPYKDGGVYVSPASPPVKTEIAAITP